MCRRWVFVVFRSAPSVCHYSVPTSMARVLRRYWLFIQTHRGDTFLFVAVLGAFMSKRDPNNNHLDMLWKTSVAYFFGLIQQLKRLKCVTAAAGPSLCNDIEMAALQLCL